MSNINGQTKDRMYLLHELVLTSLEIKLNDSESPPTAKDIELAMKFLKDNNIHVDLSEGVQEVADTLTRIPRLTRDELTLVS